MQINAPAFTHFADRWLAKATRYRANSLTGAYDRFFTTFVVYNRAYDEAARIVYAKRPEAFCTSWRFVDGKSPPPISRIGDRVKAIRGVVVFCGASLRSDVFSQAAINEAINQLILLAEQNRFYFFFDRDTGEPDIKKDLLKLHDFFSGRIDGILELLYQIRCNMFHGQKDFEAEQLQVLRPANLILNAVTRHLVQKVIDAGDLQ